MLFLFSTEIPGHVFDYNNISATILNNNISSITNSNDTLVEVSEGWNDSWGSLFLKVFSDHEMLYVGGGLVFSGSIMLCLFFMYKKKMHKNKFPNKFGNLTVVTTLNTEDLNFDEGNGLV